MYAGHLIFKMTAARVLVILLLKQYEYQYTIEKGLFYGSELVAATRGILILSPDKNRRCVVASLTFYYFTNGFGGTRSFVLRR